MFTIISFFQKLIKGGVGIRAGGLEIFLKLISGGGAIIRYSRVVNQSNWCYLVKIHSVAFDNSTQELRKILGLSVMATKANKTILVMN